LKTILVDGYLDTIGESLTQIKPNSEFAPYTTYRYLSFTDDDGRQVTVEKVRVWVDVARLLSPGTHGTFVFTKAFGQTELHGIRLADKEGVSEFIDSGLAKVYIRLLGLLVVGLILSFVFIGIPIALIAIYGMVRMPGWRKTLVKHMKQAGFQLTPAIRL